MNDYINKAKAIKDINGVRIKGMDKCKDVSLVWECADAILQIPAADVRENVKGKWVKTIRIKKIDGADYYDPVWFCSACGQEYDATFASYHVKYCYRCGADMRGDHSHE